MTISADAASAEVRTTIFVDTTALVDLTLGDLERQRVVRDAMRGYEVVTSKYVRMELRRTVGHAFAVVEALASTAPTDEEAFTWCLRQIERRRGLGSHRLTDRQSGRTLLALVAIVERLGSTPVTRALLAAYASAASELAMDPTRVGISREIDETDCDLFTPGRVQGRTLPLSCRRELAECDQSNFLESHRSELAAILEECEADAEYDDSRALAIMRMVLTTTPIEARGERRCWSLGDVIIALEARNEAALLTSNARHFRPICRAIGLGLVTY